MFLDDPVGARILSDRPFPHIRHVEYLIWRRFPDHKELKHPPGVGSPAPDPDRVKDLKLYEAELETKCPSEIDALYEAERKKEAEASSDRICRQDEQQFFRGGASQAQADLAHWSKAAYWKLDEAVALTFGWDPGAVNWSAIESRVQVSARAKECTKIRDLVQRASFSMVLPAHVAPSRFLAWAKRHDISYPPELGEFVSRWSGEIAEESFRQSEPEAPAEDRPDLPVSSDQATQSLQGKERDSALKLIIGMAVAGYRYDHRAARNDATKEIADDLTRLGIPLDPDTVRKWLREAAALHPPQIQTDSDS